MSVPLGFLKIVVRVAQEMCIRHYILSQRIKWHWPSRCSIESRQQPVAKLPGPPKHELILGKTVTESK